MSARIEGIEYCLPDGVLTNDGLAAEFPEWTPEKIESKLGIRERRVAGPDECASDLAVKAARGLFDRGGVAPADIDYVLFCTQGPDFFLPSGACIIQDRLGLPADCGALDFNLGCSGYVYGLGLAKGLVETDQADSVLLLTGDTYTKFLDPKDKAGRALFGDGASATWIRRADDGRNRIGPFVWGTDGSGAESLILRGGACRTGFRASDPDMRLKMDGPAIFAFSLQRVPEAVSRLLEKTGGGLDSVDAFVFHQANRYMLDYLRAKIGIPEDRFLCHMAGCGNTVSSSIPIVLAEAARGGTLRRGMRLMLVGFGVGLSWAAAIVEW